MQRQFERQTERRKKGEKYTQKEENEYTCMLERNKKGLEENLTSKITTRKIAFLRHRKGLKKCKKKLN
jgi:hypothetical protein